jgi:uncharacterized membrane protein
MRVERRRKLRMQRALYKKLLEEEELRRMLTMKKWYQSGTFWGSLATAVTGVGKLVVAVGAQDTQGIGTAIAVIFGAWTMWRLRKGQNTEVE